MQSLIFVVWDYEVFHGTTIDSLKETSGLSADFSASSSTNFDTFMELTMRRVT